MGGHTLYFWTSLILILSGLPSGTSNYVALSKCVNYQEDTEIQDFIIQDFVTLDPEKLGKCLMPFQKQKIFNDSFTRSYRIWKMNLW